MKRLAIILSGAAAIVAAVVLLTGGSAGGAVAGDHYACYIATDITAGGPQNPPLVSISNQFEHVTVDPGPADRLCAPTQKNTEPVTDPNTHLKRYPLTGPTFAPRTVLVTNQFGQFKMTVTGPRFLLVPSSKDTSTPPSPGAPGFEHYVCYTFKKAPKSTDQFQAVNIVVIDWSLCVPTSKNGSTIKNPQRHLLCYKTTAPAPAVTDHTVRNQFGIEHLRLTKMAQFCVPSTKQVVTG
jgi:hypothetical protein